MTDKSIQFPPDLNKLELLPVGFDPGNGFAKIALLGKVAKIPSNFATQQPSGALSNATMTIGRPKAFSIVADGRELWFGQDSLDNGTGREIDQAKYYDGYLRPLFAACLVQWLKQHRQSPDVLAGKRLNVVASMPPELYQDKATRTKVERAYSETFQHRIDWQVKNSLVDTFQLFTAFKKVTPETLTYLSMHVARSGYTVGFDFGYGTLDIAIFKDGVDVPVLTKSLNKGLLHAFTGIDALAANRVELDILRSKAYERLDSYFTEVRTIIQSITRQLPEPLKIIGIGGGVNLMSKAAKDGFNRTFSGLVLRDEFTNARANEKVASRA